MIKRSIETVTNEQDELAKQDAQNRQTHIHTTKVLSFAPDPIVAKREVKERRSYVNANDRSGTIASNSSDNGNGPKIYDEYLDNNNDLPSQSRDPRQIALPNIKTLSFHPDTFSPPFDVLYELAHNRKDYVKDDEKSVSVSIYGFPSYLETILGIIRTHVSAKYSCSRPGLHPTIGCCISYGLKVICSRSEVSRLLHLKRQFEMLSSDQIGILEREILSDWFRGWISGTLDEVGSGGTRLNLFISKDIRNAVSSLSADLGCSVTSLLTLSIAITVADQNCIPLDYVDKMQNISKNFFKRAEIRLDIAERLFSRFSLMEG